MTEINHKHDVECVEVQKNTFLGSTGLFFDFVPHASSTIQFSFKQFFFSYEAQTVESSKISWMEKLQGISCSYNVHTLYTQYRDDLLSTSNSSITQKYRESLSNETGANLCKLKTENEIKLQRFGDSVWCCSGFQLVG